MEGMLMAKLYFAKMNINDDIYKVYAGEKKLDDLLQKIYLGVKTNTIIYDEFGGRYKFFDLDFENTTGIIVGNLGYIKRGVHSSYDSENDDAKDVVDNNKLDYIVFYFDVYKEMIAFSTSVSLKRTKVPEVISDLIRKETDIGVEFVQESNLGELKSKLERVDHLSKLIVKLVPPNGDKENFARLTSLTVDKIQESNAVKIEQVFQGPRKEGLVKDSELVRNTIENVGLGYAKVKFFGKNLNHEKVEIDTDENTPYTKTLPENSSKSHSIIAEKGKSGIIDIFTAKERLKHKKE
jgi:hypothetical protein